MTQKFGLNKIINEKKYHGINEAHIDDREHNESWGLETSDIIGKENDDTAMYGNMLAHDANSVNNDVGDTKNMNIYKIRYERSIERAGNTSKKTDDFNQYKSKREKIKKKQLLDLMIIKKFPTSSFSRSKKERAPQRVTRLRAKNMLLGLTLLKITAHTNAKAVLFQNLALWV